MVVITGTVGDRGLAQCQRRRGEDVGRRRRITLAIQDIENDIGGMGAASAQAASTANRAENVDHLPIAIVGAGELAPYTFYRSRQHPGGARRLRATAADALGVTRYCLTPAGAAIFDLAEQMEARSKQLESRVFGRHSGLKEKLRIPLAPALASGC